MSNHKIEFPKAKKKNELIFSPSTVYPEQFPSIISSYSNLLIKTIVILFVFTNYDFLVAVISIISSFYIYRLLVKDFFLLEKIGFENEIYISDSHRFNQTICLLLTIDNFDKVDLRKRLKILFSKNPKLNCLYRNFLGEIHITTPYYNQYSEIKKDIIFNSRVKDTYLPSDNEVDLKNYLDREINKYPNPYICPIEFHLIELRKYKEESTEFENLKKGYLFIKCSRSYYSSNELIRLVESLSDISPIRNKKLNFFSYVQAFFFGVFWFIKTYFYDLNLNENLTSIFVNKRKFKGENITLLLKPVRIEQKRFELIADSHKKSLNEIIGDILLKVISDFTNTSTFNTTIHFEICSKYYSEVIKNSKISFESSEVKSSFLKILFFILSPFANRFLIEKFQWIFYPQIILTIENSYQSNIKLSSSEVIGMTLYKSVANSNFSASVLSYGGNLSLGVTNAREKCLGDLDNKLKTTVLNYLNN